MKIKISINGKAYDSLDQVPEELRELIDADGNGVPDVVQMEPKGAGAAAPAAQGTRKEAAAEELRAGIKALLADRDRDGIPDITQKRGPVTTRVTTTISRTYRVNGKTYKSLEEMPPEARAALARLGVGGGRGKRGPAPAQGDESWDAGPAAIRPESWLGLKGFFKRLFGRK